MNLEGYRAGLDRGVPSWAEIVWQAVRIPFFLFPCPLPSRLRCQVLRCFGARLGRGVVIRHGVDISFPWRLRCGDHVWLGEQCKILNLAEVIVGSNVCISQQAFLCTGSHRYRSESFDLVTRPIKIADSCWIGARAFIGPGVRMGQCSVVGAGAVVVRDIPPGHLAVGNPAKNRRIDAAQA